MNMKTPFGKYVKSAIVNIVVELESIRYILLKRANTPLATR